MARKIFFGQAVDIAQVATITVADTWATGDTATITIAGNDLVITVGADFATTDVAVIIARAINAATATENLFNDESRNLGGAEIPELAGITAAVSTANTSRVLLTGDIRGEPFAGSGFPDGLSVSETTAGTGTLTLATATDVPNEVQFPTGKNWWDNADNWDGDALPGNGDTFVLQNNDISIKYGLDQSAITTLRMEADASWTGQLGLPRLNQAGTTSYREWRPRFFKASWDTADGAIKIGGGTGVGSNLINIDMHTVAAKVFVAATGTPIGGERHAVNLQGGTSAQVDVRSGSSVGLGDDAGGAAVDLTSLHISTPGDLAGLSNVYVSGEVTIGTSILMNGGNLEVNSETSKTIPTLTVRGGSALVRGNVACTNFNVFGDGRVTWESTGTITTPQFKDRGTWDLSTDIRALTITNPIEIFSRNVSILDPHKRIPVGTVIDFNDIPITINDRIVLGEDQRITIAATA